jgi:hypothetical protein
VLIFQDDGVACIWLSLCLGGEEGEREREREREKEKEREQLTAMEVRRVGNVSNRRNLKVGR